MLASNDFRLSEQHFEPATENASKETNKTATRMTADPNKLDNLLDPSLGRGAAATAASSSSSASGASALKFRRSPHSLGTQDTIQTQRIQNALLGPEGFDASQKSSSVVTGISIHPARAATTEDPQHLPQPAPRSSSNNAAAVAAAAPKEEAVQQQPQVPQQAQQQQQQPEKPVSVTHSKSMSISGFFDDALPTQTSGAAAGAAAGADAANSGSSGRRHDGAGGDDLDF
jgi:hypothetical protein